MSRANQNLKIPILNLVLNFVLAREWKDYDRFCSKLCDRLVERKPKTREELAAMLKSFKTPFFGLNGTNVSQFVGNFPIDDLTELLSGDSSTPITFIDVFPETRGVDIAAGKNLTSKLDIEEELIQGAIRDSIREKNATNALERGKDSALEVADHEHFSLQVK